MLVFLYLLSVFRYNSLLPFQSPLEQDQLLAEFTEFQLLNDSDIPQDTWDKATVTESREHKYYRMDALWHSLSTLQAPRRSFHFTRLYKITKFLLVNMYTAFQCRRRESLLNDLQNKTAFWPSLDSKGTLSSILMIKLANIVPDHDFKPTKELLKTAKSAPREYTKAHSKK